MWGQHDKVKWECPQKGKVPFEFEISGFYFCQNLLNPSTLIPRLKRPIQTLFLDTNFPDTVSLHPLGASAMKKGPKWLSSQILLWVVQKLHNTNFHHFSIPSHPPLSHIVTTELPPAPLWHKKTVSRQPLLSNK